MSRTAISTSVLLVLAAALAGCGGSTLTEGSALPSGAASPAATTARSDAPEDGALVVTRTGGLAGVHDEVRIASDGTAEVTSRTGVTSTCTPEPAAVDRLRGIDLAAVGSAASKPPIADGFSYTVTSAGVTASAGDGDDEGIRAELVAAAGAVVTSCLATQSETEPPTQ